MNSTPGPSVQFTMGVEGGQQVRKGPLPMDVLQVPWIHLRSLLPSVLLWSGEQLTSTMTINSLPGPQYLVAGIAFIHLVIQTNCHSHPLLLKCLLFFYCPVQVVYSLCWCMIQFLAIYLTRFPTSLCPALRRIYA